MPLRARLTPLGAPRTAVCSTAAACNAPDDSPREPVSNAAPDVPPSTPPGPGMPPEWPDPAPTLPDVLTVDELAVFLRLNRKTVYDALARGEIPGARRIGGSYRILREAVIAWLGSGQVRVSRKRQR